MHVEQYGLTHIFLKRSWYLLCMNEELFTQFEPIYLYLTTKDPSVGCSKYSYTLNKIMIALSKEAGHLPPQFFEYTGFDRSIFFGGNQPVFLPRVDATLALCAQYIYDYLAGDDSKKDQAKQSILWLLAAFGSAIDLLFNPSSKYLLGYHIKPQTIPGYTIFASEREQLLPLLYDIHSRL
jgi:hypothetical protein